MSVPMCGLETAAEAGVKFAREAGNDLFKEIIPLILAHYKEIPVDMGEPLDPDWEQYGLMELAGYLRAYTARDSANTLIGYAVFFLRPHQHSKGSMQAFSDLLYIDRDHRGFGPAFIRWCDEQLKADGARVIYYSVTPFCDFSPILTRQGYEFVGTTYARRT